MRSLFSTTIATVAFTAAIAALSPAQAQSSASTYSYGTYNPVQAAINRNSMNAAILRQATGAKGKTRSYHAQRKTVTRRRR